MKDFGERLLKYRRQTGMSQEDFAGKLDISRQTLSKWETGQSFPDATKVQAICTTLGITPNDLFNCGNPAEKDMTEHKEKKVTADWVFDLFWLATFVCGSALFIALFFSPAMPAWWVPFMALFMMLIPTVMFIIKGIFRLICRWKNKRNY